VGTGTGPELASGTLLSPETDRTGTVVGHYRIGERMGGGMIVVYRAEGLGELA